MYFAFPVHYTYVHTYIHLLLCTYVHSYIYIETLYKNEQHIVAKHYHVFIPLISAVAGSLVGPTPNLLIVVTMTTTIPVNTPSGSDGAVNVSVVVELLTFLIVPL